MGLDDALDDVEPEAGAAALAAPPEAGEDAVHGLLRDAGPLVAHRDRRGCVLGELALAEGRRGRDVDRDSSLAVPHGIFQEVAEHLVDLVGVGPQIGQRLLDAQQEPVGRLPGGDVGLDVPSDGGADVDGLAAHLQLTGVDPRDVEQLGDEPGDPVGVGVDGLQHQPLLVVGEAFPLGEQGGGEALDRGERGAQFVGDGGDQLGVAALGAAASLGVAQGDDESPDGPGGPGADVARGDQHFTPAGQKEIALGLSDADGEATVRVGQLPPAAPLQVL